MINRNSIVIPQYTKRAVLAVLLSFILVGCSGTESSATNDPIRSAGQSSAESAEKIVGRLWALVRYEARDGASIDAVETFSMLLYPDVEDGSIGRFRGYLGCNIMGGHYRIGEGSMVALYSLLHTGMSCPTSIPPGGAVSALLSELAHDAIPLSELSVPDLHIQYEGDLLALRSVSDEHFYFRQTCVIEDLVSECVP